jgi:cell wall-associated NlpC family hydrolase
MAFTEEQRNNAKAIYEVGMSLGASMRDIQIALMAGLVESGLRNLDYGDRDSVGMFQQRDAWGSREARLDPRQSAKMFFTGGNAGQRGLLDISDRASMDMGAAAQAVQVSAFPDRYAQHASEAKGILSGIGSGGTAVPTTTVTVDGADVSGGDALAQIADLDSLVKGAKSSARTMPVTSPSVMEVNSLGEITADDAGIGALSFDGVNPALQAQTFDAATAPKNDPMAGVKMPTAEELGATTTTTTTMGAPTAEQAAEGWRNQIVAQARKMLGTPYVWGGTSYSGVDCSGLISLLYNKMGFSLPRLSADQARAGSRVALDQLQAGDLVAWDNSTRNNGADHIAIALGNGLIIEAPRPGGVVQISSIYDTGNAWGVRLKR